MMGARQENWFYRSLSDSKDRGAKWRIIGNQLIFSRVYNDDELSLSGDNWNVRNSGIPKILSTDERGESKSKRLLTIWVLQGYIANRNRTFEHLYNNDINNNIFLAGDSHQNWVSDLVWLGTKDYDPETGEGSIGVEFAGTAVTSSGKSGPIEPAAGDLAREMIARNEEMMWQEGYYRGYFNLKVSPEKVEAQFFGSPSVATRNPWDIPLANFTVPASQGYLERPIGGGKVESGAVKFGEVEHTNLTLNTDTGKWEVIGFEKMYI
jgi:alkaline phosphatase D